MDVNFVIKSMEDFLDFLKSEEVKMFCSLGYEEKLYDTFFKVEWQGKVVYIPFCANAYNGLTGILEEELEEM